MSNKTANYTSATSLNNSDHNYFKIITLLFIFSILLIDFFSPFGSVEIIAPQYLFLSLVNIVSSIFIFKNPEFLSASLNSILKKSRIFICYILFVILCTASTFLAPNFSLAIVNLMQIIIIFCTFINMSLFLYDRLELIYSICLMIGISVFIQCYLATNNLIADAKSSTLSQAFLFLMGNTGNINIFAASLTGKVPFLLLGIYHFSNWKKWFLSFTLLATLFVVFLISARAAYIALFVNIFGFLILVYFIKSEKKKYLSVLTYILIPLLLSFFMASYVFKKAEDKGRFSSITNRISSINFAKTDDMSINIRLKYWDNALQIAKENPVFGIGLGNWKIESQPYEKEISNNLTLSDHPHNDFLEIAAETGLLNLIVYLLLFIFALVANIKKIYSSSNQQSRLIAIVAILLLFSYGIDAFFNFPLYRATMQLNFCLFMAVTFLNNSYLPTSSAFNNKLTILVCAISIITFYFSYQTFIAFQFESNMTNDLKLAQPSYRYNAVVKQIPKFPNTATNSQPFIEVAAIYALSEKKYDQAIQLFNQSRKINPNTGRAEWYKYQIYKAKGSSDSAQYYANKAFEIRPRNENYFLSALVVAANRKDTTTILQLHNSYIKYNQDPRTWINTSSALAQSLYPNDKIITFIDSGLTLFPEDTNLQQRKKSFQNDSFLATAKINHKANSSKTNNLALATQYATNLNFHQALRYFKKAALEQPTNVIITQNIGICYFQTKQFKTAINYLEKTLNSPLLTDGKTEFLLGVAYLNTNNKQKGCNYLFTADDKKYPGATKIVSQYCN